MATQEQIGNALKAAHAAGDVDAARRLAAAYKAMGSKVKVSPARVAGLGMKGLSDSLLETLAAPPELIAGGMRALGLPSPEKGVYQSGLKSGYNAAGRALAAPFASIDTPLSEPENAVERFAYGSGRGVGDAASIVVPAAAAARLTQAGTVGNGIARVLSAQPASQAMAGAAGGGVGEVTDSPLLGVAASLAVPAAAGLTRRAISPVVNRLTPEQQRLAQIAQHEGIQLTPGQQTGSRNLQATESVLGQMPFAGGMAMDAQRGQREAFNRAVMARAGVNSDYAAPDVLQRSGQAIGREFETLAARNSVNLDAQFLTDLQNTAAFYAPKLPSQTREVFQNYVDDILTVGNRMPGPQYQVTRSDLSRQAKSIVNSDPTLSQALRGLRNALDEAMERSVAPADRGNWADVRQRYGAHKAISNAMSAPGADAAKGNIPPAALWNVVRAQNPNNFPRGAGELNNLARVGQAFVKDQIPDSGTNQRRIISNLLTGGAAGIVGGVGATVDPMLGAAITGGSLSIPPMVQTLMQSAAGRAYLTNQLAVGRGPQVTPEFMAALLAGRGKDAALAPPR